MAYIDYSAKFSYKDLLTYQDMNQLGANDKAIWEDVKTRYLVISCADLTKTGSNSAGYYTNSAGSYGLSDNGAGHGLAFTGLHLPDGAIITSLKGYFYAAGTVLLIQRIDGTGSASTMASVTSAGAGNNNVEDTTISNATIDNTTYSYQLYLDITSPTNYYFYMAIITYTITTPLP